MIMQPRSQGSLPPVSEGTCDDDVGNDQKCHMYDNDNYFLSKRVYRKVSCF